MSSTLEECHTIKIADADTSQNHVVRLAIFHVPPTDKSSDTQQSLVIKCAATEDAFPSSWRIPGGHKDSGETIATAIVLEMAEETVVVADHVMDEFDQMLWNSTSNGRVSVQFNCVVVIEDSEQVKLKLQEHSEYRWIAKTNIDDLAMTSEMNKV
jgi:8-oxo-dGTP pyrophosphatase MutT (NUDIX family)